MKINLIVITVFSFFSMTILRAQTNEGTDFWFGFMEHFDVGNNTMVAMVTSKNNTTGTISIPNLGWSQDFSVTANGVQIVTLPRTAETIGSESKSNNGIRVTTQLPASVYIHQYNGFRSEATVILPAESIGRSYYVMSYQGFRDEDGGTHPSEFLIVATQDETNINIVLNSRTQRGKAKGSTINITLNQGETYQVMANQPEDDLTGTYITGDKDFVLLAGNTWTQVPDYCPTRDNLLEQMYPVTAWGNIFVTVPNDQVLYDVFRILASEDNTTIEVDNGIVTRSYALDAGEFVEYLESEATYIEGNKPILVAQYNIGASCNGHPGGIGDPSMVLLNSVIQTRDTVTLYNSSFENIDENFINIIVQSSGIGDVIFDGQRLSDVGTVFNTIGPNDQFAYTSLQVSVGAHTIISEGCGVIATAYGYGRLESYAYSGGASFSNINANPIPEGGCLNDTILFDTGLSPKRYSFFWDLGDGTTTTEATFTHVYNELRDYTVVSIIEDHCLNTIDTTFRDLKVTLRQAVDTEPFQQLCQGETLSLGATDLPDARYEWTGPRGFFLEEQFPVLNNAQPNMSGAYNVIGIISGCATFPATTDVEIIALPQPDLGPDTLFCSRNNTFDLLDPGSFETYLWQDNSTASTFQVIEEGTFTVEVTDEFGCLGVDSVRLTSRCPTAIYVPNVFSPNGDQINEYFSVLGTDIIDMELSIYDRWGNLMFSGQGLDVSWDGMSKGQNAPEAVYTWVAKIVGYREDGTTYIEIKSGEVILLR